MRCELAVIESQALSAIVEEVDSALRAAGTPERAAAEKQYLKSDLLFYGATLPVIHATVKAAKRACRDLRRPDLCVIVEMLWHEPVHDRRMAAVEFLESYVTLLEPADLALIERFIREARTWALVDPLAANVTGNLVQRFPHLETELDRWSVDPDFWVRRSALLACLLPLRRTADPAVFARFTRYADAMLEEREFFIRKAIAWVLRETAKVSPQLVVAWLRPRAGRASGVTVREAVRHLPPDEREALMAAYRAGGSTGPA